MLQRVLVTQRLSVHDCTRSDKVGNIFLVHEIVLFRIHVRQKESNNKASSLLHLHPRDVHTTD